MKKVTGWRITISPEQIAWLARRSRAGGRVFIAARKQQHIQGFWLFPGTAGRQLATTRVTEVPALIQAKGNPGAWPWAEIEAALRNKS